MMTRRFFARFIWLLVTIVGVSTTTLTLAGAVGGRPAHPDPATARSQSIFVHTLPPGTSVNDAVTVTNTTSAVDTVLLYATDAAITNTGSMSCKQAVDLKQGVGQWVVIDTPEVTLQPGGEQTVGFTIRVPDGVEPGEYNGCLVFQSKSDATAPALEAVHVRTRQAVRISVTIPGDLQKKLSIQEFSRPLQDGRHIFHIVLKNDGNVSVDTLAEVNVRTVFGQVVHTVGGGYPVLPSGNLELRFQDDSALFWGGWYWAQASVSYDTRPGVFGVDNPQYMTTLLSQDIVFFVWPSPMVLLPAGIIVVGGILWIIARRRPRSIVKRQRR